MRTPNGLSRWRFASSPKPPSATNPVTTDGNPQPYAQEEIEQLRGYDLVIVDGGGVVGQFREAAGWESEEAHELLEAWEGNAHRRLEQAQNLPPERWREVSEVDH